MVSKIYHIGGLDCAEEVNALKGTVGKLPGVSNLAFNLIEGTMTVESDGGPVDEQTILDAVRQAGLIAKVVDGTDSPEGPPGDEGWNRQRGRTLMCWSSGVLVLLGFLAHTLLHGGLLHALAGGEGVSHHEFPPLVILFYAAAVVTGSWFVVPKAWLALRRLRADMNLFMTLAVLGAMIIGQWFEAGTVAFLFSFSLLLESWSVGRGWKM